MQSIYTKFIPATNTKGSKIKAWTSGSRTASSEIRKGLILTMSYDHISGSNSHRLAAQALAERLGWAGRWVEGEGPDGKGSVYVYAETANGFKADGFAIAAREG